MINKLKLFTASVFLCATLVTPQLSYGSEESLLPEIAYKVLRETVVLQGLENEEIFNLASVCKAWLNIIVGMDEARNLIENNEVYVNTGLWVKLYGIETDEDQNSYLQFLKLKIRYEDRLQDYCLLSSKKTFLISNFSNPLNIVLDVFQLKAHWDSNVSRYVKIMTNPAEFFRCDKSSEDIMNILITPSFRVRKFIDPEISETSAQVAIFWRLAEEASSQYMYYVPQVDNPFIVNLFRDPSFLALENRILYSEAVKKPSEMLSKCHDFLKMPSDTRHDFWLCFRS